MKNQDDLYQNDVGSTLHILAFTTWVIAIAAQKIIDVICFCFKLMFNLRLLAFRHSTPRSTELYLT